MPLDLGTGSAHPGIKLSPACLNHAHNSDPQPHAQAQAHPAIELRGALHGDLGQLEAEAALVGPDLQQAAAPEQRAHILHAHRAQQPRPGGTHRHLRVRKNSYGWGNVDVWRVVFEGLRKSSLLIVRFWCFWHQRP